MKAFDPRAAVSKNRLLGLWRLMTGYRLGYVTAALSTGIATVSQTGTLLLVRRFIDVTLPSRSAVGIVLVASSFVGLAVLQGVFSFLSGTLAARTAEGTIRRLRDAFYDHLQRLPFGFIDKTPTGDLVERATSDMDAVRRFYADQAIGFGRVVLQLGVNFAALFLLNNTLALVSVIVMPFVLGVSVVFFRAISKRYEKYQEQEAILSTTLQENLTGVRVVKAFARQTFEKERFEKVNNEKYRRGRRLVVMNATFWPLTDIFCSAQMITGFVFGALLAIRGTITVGTYIAFSGMITQLIWPIRFLGRLIVDISSGLVSYERVMAFCALVSAVAVGDGIFTFLNKRIIDEAITARDPTRILPIALVYGAIILVQAIGVFGMVFFAGTLGERVQYDLRKTMFDHLQALSFSYYDKTPVGWIMARVTSDSGRISGLITWGLNDVCWALANIIASSIFMFLIDWRLAAVVFVSIPFLLVVAVQFKNRIVAEYRKVRRLNSKITASYNESIQGVRVVKALCREEKNLCEFSRLTGDMRAAGFRAAWLSALFLPIVQLISAVAVGAIVWFGGHQAQMGLITVGGIQAFLGYVTFMMWPIQDLARVYADMQQSIASAERTFSLIDAVPEVVDRPGTLAAPPSIAGDIDFSHVDFSYAQGKPVLSDFTLHVARGQTVALVGPTGGGKSTIVNLVCRFYEPQGGEIRINGVDYLKLPLHAIQSRIGMVLQTPHLFSGTVRENIRYGRLDATDGEVEDAARMAGAHDFITSLERSYGSEVGEGGNRLSVGQKQLISLARAILAKPEIFIMDEATSSVDTLTESLIQRGMEALMKGRTRFIIAHRLSTIRRADRIVVIDGGRIAEAGTHAELIRERGHYYDLYTRQFRHEREEGAEALSILGSDAS